MGTNQTTYTSPFAENISFHQNNYNMSVKTWIMKVWLLHENNTNIDLFFGDR